MATRRPQPVGSGDGGGGRRDSRRCGPPGPQARPRSCSRRPPPSPPQGPCRGRPPGGSCSTLGLCWPAPRDTSDHTDAWGEPLPPAASSVWAEQLPVRGSGAGHGCSAILGASARPDFLLTHSLNRPKASRAVAEQGVLRAEVRSWRLTVACVAAHCAECRRACALLRSSPVPAMPAARSCSISRTAEAVTGLHSFHCVSNDGCFPRDDCCPTGKE